MNTTNSGKAFAPLDIAVDGKNNTTYIKGVAWGKNAKYLALHAHKGSMVYISGKLMNTYTKDTLGNKHQHLLLSANRAQVFTKQVV